MRHPVLSLKKEGFAFTCCGILCTFTIARTAHESVSADGLVRRRRFLTLVDVLYEHNIRLFCSSEGLPFELFQHIMTRSQAKEPKVMQVSYSASTPC